jgi:protein-disulfide isomerase
MSQLKPPASDADHVAGSLDAAIVLVEYGDFECAYCGEAYPQIKTVQRAMGDALCFVFRHFPLKNMHPHAQRAAEFAEAASTIGRFWEMHDLLYENQQALDDHSLSRYATQLGFTQQLIQAALRGDFEAKVREDFRSGVRSGVNGTPCLFINGQRYDGPADATSVLETLKQRIAGTL